MWVQKWSAHWKPKGEKVLQYFLDILIFVYKLSSIFTRWFNCLFGSWKINWPHKKLALAFMNNVIKFQKNWFRYSGVITFLIFKWSTDKNAFGQFGWFSPIGSYMKPVWNFSSLWQNSAKITDYIKKLFE